jgi:hypothetical protein
MAGWWHRLQPVKLMKNRTPSNVGRTLVCRVASAAHFQRSFAGSSTERREAPQRFRAARKQAGFWPSYFNSFIMPGTLHCCCRLSAAQPYSAVIAFASSSWLFPPRISAVARAFNLSTLSR